MAFALFGYTGSFNTGVGAAALALNDGDSNTAVGTAALLLNSSGTQTPLLEPMRWSLTTAVPPARLLVTLRS